MMKITGLSHLNKWENLHNWWLTKYFFAPLCVYIYTHIYVYHLKYYTSDYIICAREKNVCKNIKSCFIYILIKVNFEIVL